MTKTLRGKTTGAGPRRPDHDLLWCATKIRWTCLILIAAGLVVVLEAFARFGWVGFGAPAPKAPTRSL